MANGPLYGQADSQVVRSIHFEKWPIASESYESVDVFDVDNDGNVDIVSGAFWYEGPSFEKRHDIGGPKRFGEYYDHFSTIPLDVDGDGKTDFVTGGWFDGRLVWKKNTGKKGPWPEHLIAEIGNIETTRAWDIDGDGVLEIVPNTPNDSLRIHKLVRGESGKEGVRFLSHAIADKQGHGLGFGDINGDGRVDIVVPNGWLEAPERPLQDAWPFHQEFDLGTTSVPIIVADVNHDGLSDLIAGQGHGYGLHWYEQIPLKKGKGLRWKKHVIDPFNSQYHTMEWEDLDGDGQNELVTGKRYKAHNGKDPGGFDPVGLYYFKWTGENFSKQVIDYGTYGKGKGTGVYFAVSDVNNDHRKDVVVAGKDGLVVFLNKELKTN
ncbi:FG-GAP repeat domain-containing protein [Pseudozobellia thermophila]|nr:VCBS repeat-containing protein [Pseudozobellia thermophila]